MQITTSGIDISKTVSQLHGVDSQGQVVLTKRVSRGKLLSVLADLTPCRVGLEACGGAHDWAREITQLGHEVKMMAPQHVKPYVHGNKRIAAMPFSLPLHLIPILYSAPLDTPTLL